MSTTETESSSSGSTAGSQCSSPTPSPEHTCAHCNEKYKQPRVLPCLHVFCTSCITELATDALNVLGRSVTCPLCQQCITLPVGGVEALPLDHVLVELLDMLAIHDMQIVCTSCKAREKALARCSDCANFLCPNCVTAHRYMRCFENHKVVSFEELQNGEQVTLHRPLFCPIHPTENMKYFCESCQTPVCGQCVLTDHSRPDHQYELLEDVEVRQSEELQNLVSESQSKLEFCEEASGNLGNALSELQMQRDNARGLIQETFQSYKAILEKKQEQLLEELEHIHSSQELAVMDLCHSVEKTVEKIEDSCKFTERLLKHGSAVEVALMKKAVSSRLLSLINNTPSVEPNTKILFETNAQKFEAAIKESFGNFKRDEEVKADSPDISLSSPVDMDSFVLPTAVLGAGKAILSSTQTDFAPGLAGLPPLSMPSLTNPLSSAISMVTVQAINNIATSIQNLPAAAPERSSSRSSYSPAMSDSGISVDTGSSSSGSTQSVINLSALSKLGTLNVNGQGQITFDGQVIPGLNVNNASGLTLGTRTQTPTPTPSQGLTSLLGSSRSQTPQLTTDLAGLLNQTASQLNGLGILGSGASLSSPGVIGSSGTGGTSIVGAGASLGAVGAVGGTASGAGAATGTPGVLPPPVGLSSLNGGLSMPPPPIGPSSFTPSAHPSYPSRNTSKMAAMQIRCKFGQLGPGKGQFNSPHGFCLGMDEDIIVADTNNHRVQVFEKTGEFKYQFGIPGREEGQLWYPRKVAVIRQTGKYVVCDRGNERSRMQIFTKNGHFVKKIAIRYIDIVAGLAITSQGHIVAVDSVSPTVFCIGEAGDLIKWFDCSDYMREPSDIAISGNEYFVCDFKGHCVVVFNEDGQFLRRIGCENITNFPNGIDISDAGDVLVGDSHGNRFHVAVFQRDGSLIGEFECPYVKVSRCCGLKISSEGYVVTLAKNNHHVLILNTLYIA
ncbi:hypothetical protein NP493_1453g00037 [Ridgeia piscesae]|uniref:Brain tumor protein n=1 Tax=Ridgeia piscesae TaxID=27915 RepID=A0AAD9NAY6_RIDPI|nr:hypothetical protein NP493_1453g00037 [Ridgeia piscesae]